MSTLKKPPKIEILPEHIIDQIKAGEVLERPASLIKELLENSLDAGATEINIQLVQNGLDLLSIEDNGHGMSFDTLPFAFLRHATSKLKSFEDLYHLHSFGFRGEALASVAACARINCTSQPTDLSVPGGKIIINGGAQELHIPYQSSTHGTALFIKDLFYNTPARLKFIKSKVSEKSALKKMLNAFVLSNPKTTFSIKWDDVERENYKIVADPDDNIKRVEQVFFSKLNKDMVKRVWHHSEFYEDYRLEVYFTPTTHTTPQYRHHYLFANKRFFQDKSLHQAILRALEPLWRHGESGHYMVNITVPPEEVDVNVHPNKTQIKFLKSDIIYSLLVTALRSTLKREQAIQERPLQQDTQSSFFNRQESQSLDLLNISSSSQKNWALDFESAPLNIAPSFPGSPDMPSLLGAVGRVLIIRHLNKFFIGDAKKIMAAYICESLKKFIEQEEPAGPLLISEPFNIVRGKIDSHFEDLKSMGFEVDRLNTEVVALRTLPRFCSQNISREVTSCLLNYFGQSKVKKFDLSELENFIAENWPGQIVPNEQMLQVNFHMYEQGQKHTLHELTEEKLKGLVK